MSDATHLQNYQRFFAILFSVLPGLNVIVTVAGLVLWLVADVAEAEWGLGVGLAALTFAILTVVWIFVGIGVRTWAEQKPLGMLAGACAPFIIVDAIFMSWLFYFVVIAEHEEPAATSAAAILTAVGSFLA
ncbi:MAG: hypothetical protein H6719_12225 [Sandaracinaceae bacterium]|nr:hypothetical protein [Sandaracinaceae bacterium]